MWHEARKQEKLLNAKLVDYKARAQRRAIYYKSKLADPAHLLRITGTQCQTFPDAQQFYYNENESNLSKWQGDGETTIDRFDCRQLLDFIPTNRPNDDNSEGDGEDDELNFECYRDLLENEHLGKSEEELLKSIDDNWNELLVRRNGGDGSTSQQGPAKTEKAAIGFTYAGTSIAKPNEEEEDDDSLDEEPPAETRLPPPKPGASLELDDEDSIASLNALGKTYGITDFYDSLQISVVSEGGTSARGRKGFKHQSNASPPRSRRASPSYAPYARSLSPAGRNQGIANQAGAEEAGPDAMEFITEFAIEPSSDSSRPGKGYDHSEEVYAHEEHAERSPNPAGPSRPQTTTPAPPAKMTMMQKLKAKAQQALEKQSQIIVRLSI
ncbi:alternative splicing regulator-domain-containing protein [Fimicolochytrium jonesii]|uniref:alternative splicing regulator-domain-containing protein n=1 Tax=Fimicolochytrium jonesii TaxID=1396493 RepID=UPI0022FE05F6|nr:alternative splicing regulator-domain-containing protein [Fimicolochytrium jonesii]KAI8824977.1 alternative splicing regulator-domain-containing protein [Fimicolochytrium jonesii]